MSHLVTISLDSKTFAIWKRLPGNKSAWVRQMIAMHAINDTQLIEHLSTPTEEWGLWIDDARCNPGSLRGYCVACWSPIEQQEMAQFSSVTDYIKARRMTPHPKPKEHEKKPENKPMLKHKDVVAKWMDRLQD
jgi:hypothetical protein